MKKTETRLDLARRLKIPSEQTMLCDKCGRAATNNKWGVCQECRHNRVCEKCGAGFSTTSKKYTALSQYIRFCGKCRLTRRREK